MVTRTTVEVTDDVDGKSVAAETVEFGLDSVTYQIDISVRNAAKLRKAIEPYLGAARRTGGREGRIQTIVATAVDNTAVRAWAASNGYEVSSRGRISAEVVDAFRAAGN
jgi:hypothetical protein